MTGIDNLIQNFVPTAFVNETGKYITECRPASQKITTVHKRRQTE